MTHHRHGVSLFQSNVPVWPGSIVTLNECVAFFLERTIFVISNGGAHPMLLITVNFCGHANAGAEDSRIAAAVARSVFFKGVVLRV